jgi:hypothetical protein
MNLRLLSRFRFTRRRVPAAPRRRLPSSLHFRPSVETLEGRLVLSSFVRPDFAAALVSPAALGPQQVSPINILPLQITGLQLMGMQNVTMNGKLVSQAAGIATGQLGSNTFQVPFTLMPHGNAADPTCPILSISIPNGVHLSLLGLNVDTSGICLNITAQTESGNLLGNLLCDVANLLNQPGLDLNTLLTDLGSDLTNLLSGLQGLLNGALTQATTVSFGSTTFAQPSVSCNILHLSLGPVMLNVLGLNVALDDCHGGPVTVDITATPGAGNLLGNLLCDLTNLLNSGSRTLAGVENSLESIASDILSLI